MDDIDPATSAEVLQQMKDHADLMRLGRLKYIQKEDQSELLAAQVALLEKRIGREDPNRSSTGSSGQPVEQGK